MDTQEAGPLGHRTPCRVWPGGCASASFLKNPLAAAEHSNVQGRNPGVSVASAIHLCGVERKGAARGVG